MVLLEPNSCEPEISSRTFIPCRKTLWQHILGHISQHIWIHGTFDCTFNYIAHLTAHLTAHLIILHCIWLHIWLHIWLWIWRHICLQDRLDSEHGKDLTQNPSPTLTRTLALMLNPSNPSPDHNRCDGTVDSKMFVSERGNNRIRVINMGK